MANNYIKQSQLACHVICRLIERMPIIDHLWQCRLIIQLNQHQFIALLYMALAINITDGRGLSNKVHH